MQRDDLPDFTGKLEVFYTSSAPRGIQDGVLMEFISFAEHGGRLFVTGRLPEVATKDLDWVSNLQTAIAWNDVTNYVVFNSREDYVARVKTAPRSLFRRLFGL